MINIKCFVPYLDSSGLINKRCPEQGQQVVIIAVGWGRGHSGRGSQEQEQQWWQRSGTSGDSHNSRRNKMPDFIDAVRDREKNSISEAKYTEKRHFLRVWREKRQKGRWTGCPSGRASFCGDSFYYSCYLNGGLHNVFQKKKWGFTVIRSLKITAA